MRSLLIAVSLISSLAIAKPVRTPVSYTVDKDTFEGVFVYDDEGGKRPGLLLVPNWLGINEANLTQAQLVAGAKYVVFVADVFGKGKAPKDMESAGKMAGALKEDRKLLRKRVQAALKAMLADKKAPLDGTKVAATGFCFGGTTALELARSGANLAGVVVFHAGLATPTPDDAKNIKGKVLALQGADDPYVPAAERAAFEDEMRKGKVDWQLVAFGGAVHSFTDPDAKMAGQAMYDEKVAKRAYVMADAMFGEVFAK